MKGALTGPFQQKCMQERKNWVPLGEGHVGEAPWILYSNSKMVKISDVNTSKMLGPHKEGEIYLCLRSPSDESLPWKPLSNKPNHR